MLPVSCPWRHKHIILFLLFSLFTFIGVLLIFNPSLRQPPQHFVTAGHDSSERTSYYYTTNEGNDLITNASWTFDPLKDGENYGLSDLQCSSAFPRLYTSIDDMVARHASNPIRAKDLNAELHGDHAVTLQVKAMIFDGEMFVIEDKGMTDFYGTRLFATLDSLHRALVSFPDRANLPNCEFIISWGDKPARGAPVWGYTKKDSSEYYDTWLMPDFGFFSWPEPKTGAYTEVRRAIRRLESETSFEEKVPKLVWRGALLVEDREKLLDHSKGKDWADVRSINWGDKEDLQKNHLTLANHCRFMFIAHVSGLSWSGQGKYIRNCHSVVVSQSLEWREIYDSALVYSGPGQNAVRVADDWSDLEATIKTLLSNTTVAKSIADNARSVLRDRYLTPAAETCYWRRLIQGYASVSFDPELYEADEKTLRGVPYESFTLLRKVHWDAY